MKMLNEVLIIDDDEVNNLLCEIIIEHVGISNKVSQFTNGQQGLEYLSSCIDTNLSVPDLILLDVNMPVMDGFEFLDYYQERGYHKRLHSKIAMLSSSEMHFDVKRALSYECVINYVTKPLLEKALGQLAFQIASLTHD